MRSLVSSCALCCEEDLPQRKQERTGEDQSQTVFLRRTGFVCSRVLLCSVL